MVKKKTHKNNIYHEANRKHQSKVQKGTSIYYENDKPYPLLYQTLKWFIFPIKKKRKEFIIWNSPQK